MKMRSPKLKLELKSRGVTNFERNVDQRIICDASCIGLCALLLQRRKNNDEWQPIHFVFRFLIDLESKYSTIELELLAVAWSPQNFRNYMYRTKFQLSYHNALSSVLKRNSGKRKYSSR